MRAAARSDDEVSRAAANSHDRDGSYSVSRTPRRRPRLLIPVAALGAGLVLGGGVLAVLQAL